MGRVVAGIGVAIVGSIITLYGLASPAAADMPALPVYDKYSTADLTDDIIAPPREQQRDTPSHIDMPSDERRTASTPAASQPTSPPVVSPSPAPLSATPVFITGYYSSGRALEYIQLHNTSSSLLSLDGWIIRVASKDEEFDIELSGWIEPKTYMVVARGDAVQSADAYVVYDEFDLPIERVTLIPSGYTRHSPAGGNGYVAGVRYAMIPTDAGNYTAARTFRDAGSTPLYGGGHYEPEDAPPLRVVELLANSPQCAPTDHRTACHHYVKLYNDSNVPLDVSPYRLRTGHKDQSAGIANTMHLQGVVPARGFLTVSARDDGKPFSIAPSGGYVWLEDRYGLEVYQSSVVEYHDIGGVKNRGLAWGYNEATKAWQWTTPNPSGANDFRVQMTQSSNTSTLKPCRPDQYRSLETNRCRLINPASSTPVPCRPDQYRSPETNRCRLINPSGSTLKPCRADQYRSPETNRCRLIASASSSLTPCREGQERNPATNRCRQIRSAAPPAAAFPVDEIADTTSAFIGWGALLTVGVLGIGYAAWEWRHEIAKVTRKIPSIFPTGKK